MVLLAFPFRLMFELARLLLRLVMAFRVPAMPLAINIYRYGTDVANPPDVITIGNLSPGKRVMSDPLFFIGLTNTAGVIQNTFCRSLSIPMELLLPKGTDIRSYEDPQKAGDCVECPAGSGRYYWVFFVDDVAKGFANEYRIAIMLQQTPAWMVVNGNPWNTPFPAWPMP